MSYLYTQLTFQWSYETYSKYRAFQTSLYVVVTLLVTPLLTKCCGVRDVFIVFIGAPAHALARVIFALAKSSVIFYVGAAVSSLGPSVAPVLRSMTSKIVNSEERGVVFAVLTVADSAVPLISGPLYSQVYNAFVDSNPAAFFWITVASQAILFFFILYIHIFVGKRQLDSGEDRDKSLAHESS